MTPLVIPASPLSLNQFTRDYWGQYDPAVIAQLAQLANDPCYTVKLYKAPADNQEVIGPYGYVTYGMQITPGSLIYGTYLPAIAAAPSTPTQAAPVQFTVQIRDVSLEHNFFDEPIASLFLANFKPTYQTAETGASAAPLPYLNMGSFPNLWCAEHPVTGSGQFDIQIQNTGTNIDTGVGISQRIEFVLGVLEVCEHGQ